MDLNFSEARQCCSSVGGHLVSIHSQEEEAFLLDMIDQVPLWTGGFRSTPEVNFLSEPRTGAKKNFNCTENLKHIFTEMKLPGLVHNFYILESMSDLYIPMIGPRQADRGNK